MGVMSCAEGNPPMVINELAEERSADLLAMETRGLSRWKRLVLGSTAKGVAFHAPCPVLTVPCEREA